VLLNTVTRFAITVDGVVGIPPQMGACLSLEKPSEVEGKVSKVTSNAPAPPSRGLVDEIVNLTFRESCEEIIQSIDKRLNEGGANWRIISKSLSLLQNCLNRGSRDIYLHFRSHPQAIEVLQQFSYSDGNQDHGAGIRTQAKDIIKLLRDDSKWREAEERSRARHNANAAIPHSVASPSMPISPLPPAMAQSRRSNSFSKARRSTGLRTQSMSASSRSNGRESGVTGLTETDHLSALGGRQNRKSTKRRGGSRGVSTPSVPDLPPRANSMLSPLRSQRCQSLPSSLAGTGTVEAGGLNLGSNRRPSNRGATAGPISIALKNLGPNIVEYSYNEGDETRSGRLSPQSTESEPLRVSPNRVYAFQLRCSGQSKLIWKPFTAQDTYLDLAAYFR